MKVIFKDVVKRANTKEDRFNTEKIYYVGGEHIHSNELLINERGIIKGSTIGPMFYFGFKAGQVLFVTRNPHLRKAAMVEFDGICSEKTLVLETMNPSVLSQDYLPIIMQSDNFWHYCEEHKSGGVNYFINWSTLADYEFELPSLEEQHSHSQKIWAAYRLRESYKKLLAATDEMVKSQFIEMFGYDRYSKFELDAIAKSWSKGQSFKKDNICKDGKQKCIHYGELFTEYGPVIDEVVSSTNSLAIKKSTKGDILFPASDVTPIGLARCSTIMQDDILLGGDIIILSLNGQIPEYVSFAINMQKEQLIKRVTGSVVRHMSAKSLKSLTIPLPPVDKQKMFVDTMRQADKSKFELKQCIENIDKVIKSLINR